MNVSKKVSAIPMYQNQQSENRRTTTITLFEVGELHPLDAIACFGWTDTQGAYLLNLSVEAIRSYRRGKINPNANNKRNPSSRTLQYTWERCRNLLQQGIKPSDRAALPDDLKVFYQL